MKKVTAVLIGAGNRGMESLGTYALRHPYELEFKAVAEPVPEKRTAFAKLHNIPGDMCFSTWEELLAKPKMADAALICTQDKTHHDIAIKALEKGYHLLLEKPMATTPKECIDISNAASEHNRIVMVCHVLRYTGFFSKLKELLDRGTIGRLITIQHNENVGYYHFAHSYVRGNWRNSKEASPIILAKSCHDMDIMLWLAGADCVRLSSFGDLTHFRAENAPAGAPDRCLDGCPVQSECPYYAPNTYLTTNTGWPTSVISTDTSIEARTRALQEGPYGRCVFRCDNDVADHQVVNMEFANGVTAAFTLSAFTKEISRTLKLMGTKGEIRGNFEKNEIEILDFNSGTRETIQLKDPEYGHGGGDDGLMREFVKVIEREACGGTEGLTSAGVSVQSHLMAFAAENSRLEGRIVYLKEF